MLYYKAFDTVIKAVTPTPSEMDLINSYALESLTPEQVFVGRMALCNDQYDRRHERIPESYLKRFVDTGVGKSVLTGHNYNTDPVGRFFDAEIRKTAGRLDYVPSYYMMSDDPLVPKIKAGIIKHVSVGFYPDIRICDLCEKDYDGWWNSDDDDYCTHLKGREYEVNGQKVMCRVTYGGDVEKVEKVEGSFVWLGCQYGAETIAKGADGRALDIGPEAKRAFILARNAGESRVWALSAAGILLPDTEKRPPQGAAPTDKEKNVSDKERKEGESAASDPKQEALAKMGAAYKARILKSIETSYAACGMEATGKAIAKALEAVEDVDDLEQAEKDAQATFDAAHKPGGAGKPESKGDQAAQDEAHKLTLAGSPMGGWEEDYL